VISPLRSTAFRIGLAQATTTLVVLLVLSATLWWITTSRLDRQLFAEVEDDTRTMATLTRDAGLKATVQTIESRVGSELDEDEILLLTGSSYARLAGNLPAWPPNAPKAGEGGEIPILRGGEQSEAYVLHTDLPAGYHLLVGRDMRQRTTLRTQFNAGVAGAALMVMLSAIICAWIVRRNFVARIAQLDATAQAIVTGQLQQRLPVKDERDELDLLSGTINRMLDHIEQLIGGVRNVSNTIAHDLRTPLGELRTRLEELLRAKDVPDRAAEKVTEAIEDTDRLISTFNALLRLAKLDTGVEQAGFALVDLGSVIEQAVELYGPLAETKGLDLKHQIKGRVKVIGDPVLLGQAVANLLDNALKYSPEDTDVRVEAYCAGATEVAIEVADHGPGIPAAERPHVTERFFRGVGSAGTTGVGLGLSTVDAIARLHRGHLQLRDNEPGLRASLTLPLAKQNMATPFAPATNSGVGHNPTMADQARAGSFKSGETSRGFNGLIRSASGPASS
jgi:signal transduction histidine kinase